MTAPGNTITPVVINSGDATATNSRGRPMLGVGVRNPLVSTKSLNIYFVYVGIYMENPFNILLVPPKSQKASW